MNTTSFEFERGSGGFQEVVLNNNDLVYVVTTPHDYCFRVSCPQHHLARICLACFSLHVK